MNEQGPALSLLHGHHISLPVQRSTSLCPAKPRTTKPLPEEPDIKGECPPPIALRELMLWRMMAHCPPGDFASAIVAPVGGARPGHTHLQHLKGPPGSITS